MHFQLYLQQCRQQAGSKKRTDTGDRVTFSRVYYDSNGNVIGGIRYNQDDESKPVVQSAVPAESEGDTENIQSVEEQSPEKQEELTQEFVGEEENSEIQEEDSQAEGNKSEDGQEFESTEENELN